MAGISLSVTIDDRELRGGLDALIALDREDALHPAWDAIGELMVSTTQSRFDKQHGPDGAPWIPSKRALRVGGRTLIETARLFGSITHNVLGNGVEWGTNVVYAAIHQLGGTIHRKARTQTIYRRQKSNSNRFVKKSKSDFATEHAVGAHDIIIPARPFLGLDEEDRVESENILARHVERALVSGAKGFTARAP